MPRSALVRGRFGVCAPVVWACTPVDVPGEEAAWVEKRVSPLHNSLCELLRSK